MAYDIPVLAWIIDKQQAIALLNDPVKFPPGFFDSDRNDRQEGVELLEILTAAPVQYFGSEDGSVFHLGVRVHDDWCLDLAALTPQAWAIKKKYPHPLIQAARLCAVSEFC